MLKRLKCRRWSCATAQPWPGPVSWQLGGATETARAGDRPSDSGSVPGGRRRSASGRTLSRDRKWRPGGERPDWTHGLDSGCRGGGGGWGVKKLGRRVRGRRRGIAVVCFDQSAAAQYNWQQWVASSPDLWILWTFCSNIRIFWLNQLNWITS